MPKTITERRLEILKWEKENRSLKNRGTKPGKTQCFYHLEGTPGCAVGRLVSEELAKTLVGSVGNIFHELPKDIQELGRDFLSDLQAFHDCAANFTDGGLSERGIKQMGLLEVSYAPATV